MWEENDIIPFFTGYDITPAGQDSTDTLMSQSDVMRWIMGGCFIPGDNPNISTAYSGGLHAYQNLLLLKRRKTSQLPSYIDLSQMPLYVKPGIWYTDRVVHLKLMPPNYLDGIFLDLALAHLERA